MRRRPAAFFAAFAVVALALAPALAEARPGGSSSSGSRGSRTQAAPPPTQTAPGGAQQMQRTQTPPSTPAQTAGAPSAARPAGAAAAQGSFFSRNPMMAGLMGGLLGAGLFGLLSGSGLFGGMAGFASFMGLLLQIALIGGLVYLAMRLIRGRRQPAMAGAPGTMPLRANAPNAYARDMQQTAAVHTMGGGAAAPVAARPVQVEEADFSAFAETLVAVNAAWSRQDLTALRRLSTPEMTNYFADDLNALRARNWTNTTSDVRLEQGDLSEAWNEEGRDYATVAMRFSLIDVTRAADGTVTEGSPTERQMTTELWTFVRHQGSPWMLSAIQQTG